MKKIIFSICLLTLLSLQHATAIISKIANEPDSAYLFSYATTKNSNMNGLHFVLSTDQENWNPIDPEFHFLFCDYGRWGVEKRMITPFLVQNQDGI